MTSDKTYDFSMVAGEFIDVYSKQISSWDCVVTCFFLDTAHNVMEYLECISKILKKGGLWVNIGPLLYHYSEQPDEVQIELPWSEIEKLIPKFGFKFRKQPEFRECVYTSDQESMMLMKYQCVYFSAVKE
jgi:carnosine N-methyltransferase